MSASQNHLQSFYAVNSLRASGGGGPNKREKIKKPAMQNDCLLGMQNVIHFTLYAAIETT